MIKQKTNGRVRIQSLHLDEDSKNSATFTPRLIMDKYPVYERFHSWQEKVLI